MKVVKPQRLGVLCRTFEDGAPRFVVSVLVFFPIAPSPRPLSEIEMWKFAGSTLGDEPIDAGMPKLAGEVLVTGSAFPLGGPRPACAPRLAIERAGARPVDKTLYVVGDRWWRRGVASDPIPFTEMPITWERAFGGERYPANPLGKGHGAISGDQGDVQHPLPNVEDPRRLVRSPTDQPPPAGFGACDLAWPAQQARLGTHDAAWLKERFPGFARDIDWSVWNVAPEDQRIAGFFRGDESFVVEYMHPEKPRLEGRLPGVQARAFVTRREAAGDAFLDLTMHLDTVRLFPGAERGIAIFRGSVDVAEDDAADVAHLLVACEDLEQPKPAEHYRRVLAERLEKKRGAFLALRDRDLMPAGDADEPAPLAEPIEPQPEGLLRKRLRRRAEAEHDKARRRLIALGQDPATIPDLPAEPPPASLDELPDVIERANETAEQAKADATRQRASAEQSARAALASQGLDYDAQTQAAVAASAGPPRFSAENELRRLNEIARTAKAAGLDTSELDAELADPALVSRLQATEARLREGYRRGAHVFPPAATRRAEEAARLRAVVVARRAAGASLAGYDLTGADLSFLDLTRADFKGAFLEGASFERAELGGADFSDAVLARADLAGANLFAATLAGANLGGAKLVDAELGSADLTGAILAKADLSRARLREACVARADLSEAVLAEADLGRLEARGLRLLRADLTGIRFAEADLTKSIFIECKLAGASFEEACLVAATFVTVTGERARFRRANLENARLVGGCVFEGADFQGARLLLANLRETKLSGADFGEATLERADFSNSDLTSANLRRANARGARFIRADLSRATMAGIDLLEGSLEKAVIVGADLRGANLFRADLARAVASAATNLKDANVKRARVVPPKRGGHAAV